MTGRRGDRGPWHFKTDPGLQDPQAEAPMQSQLKEMVPTTILFYATISLLICKANGNRSLQELALLQWKASLADANSLPSWSTEGNSTCCSWLGVACDATGHVVELSLPSAGLRGQLDAFDFAVFPNLAKLNLNNNSLAGAIHNLCTNLMVPNLVYQYLNLSSNGFSLLQGQYLYRLRS